MLVFGGSGDLISHVKARLVKELKVENLGITKGFLDVKIDFESGTAMLSQSFYYSENLKKSHHAKLQAML